MALNKFSALSGFIDQANDYVDYDQRLKAKKHLEKIKQISSNYAQCESSKTEKNKYKTISSLTEQIIDENRFRDLPKLKQLCKNYSNM